MQAIGIDTHKDSLAACRVDERGAALAERTFANTAPGHRSLLAWIDGGAAEVVFGIEGSASFGAPAARFLVAAGARNLPPPCGRHGSRALGALPDHLGRGRPRVPEGGRWRRPDPDQCPTRPPFVAAEMVYEVDGRTFRQPFTARVLSRAEISGELRRQELRDQRQLTPTWLEAGPILPGTSSRETARQI